MKSSTLLFSLLLIFSTVSAQFSPAGGNDIYYDLGKVGIGNSSPTSPLDVGNATISTFSPSSSQVLGLQVRNSYNTNGLRTGSLFYSSQTGNNTLGLSSLSSYVYSGNNGSGNIAFSNAIQALTEHRSSGSISWTRGVFSEGWVNGSGSVNNWSAFYSNGISNGNTATGQVLNGYGLYLAPLGSAVVNKYAIYAPDAQAKSEFGGKVLLNNTSTLQITSGSPGLGKVLTSDNNGNASWQSLSGGGGSGWSLTGNSNLLDGVHFLGTTDNTALSFRVNNLASGRIDDANYNTFFGVNSGKNAFNQYPQGALNTAYGWSSLANTTVGFGNTAIGIQSMFYNVSGYDNTALGCNSLIGIESGFFNTAVGFNASSNNKSGGYNSALGTDALASNETGSYNTGVGFFAMATIGGPDLNNATVIGSEAVVNANNKVRIGNTTTTLIEGQVDWSWPSDGRFKRNINYSNIKGLDFINKLKPVSYTFDTKAFQNYLVKHLSDSIQKVFMNNNFTESSSLIHNGLIAQEVELAAKESGYEFPGLHKPKNDSEYYSISYAQFVMPLIKAVQELSDQNKHLFQEIQELKKQVDACKKNEFTYNK